MTTTADTIAALETELSHLNSQPCDRYDRAAEHPAICLEPRHGEGPSWGDMNPDRMDLGCRAYWHLSMAVDALRRLDRLTAGDTQR